MFNVCFSTHLFICLSTDCMVLEHMLNLHRHAGLLSVIVDLLQESVDREVIQWLILIIHQLTMSGCAPFC